MTSTTFTQAVSAHRGRVAAAWAVVCCLVLLAGAATARAESVLGAPGANAGQYGNPRGIAVDDADGTVYVADRANNRIDVFEAAGGFVEAFGWGVADGISATPQVCTITCFAGLEGTGGGEFDEIDGIAVDNDPASPSQHDVYVLDGGNSRVQKFSPTGDLIWAVGGKVDKTTGADLCTATSGDTCGAGSPGFEKGQFQFSGFAGIATGPGGAVYVMDEQRNGSAPSGEPIYAKRIQRFAPSGAEEAEISLVGGLIGGTTALAVGPTGDIYTGTSGSEGAVNKYDSSGALIERLQPSYNINALAFDSAGDLFVADNSYGSAVYEYDASGTLRSVIYGSLEHRVTGLALYHSATGDIFALEEGRFPTSSGVVYMPFPAPGPVVFSDTSGVVGNVRATLQAGLNPEGAPTTLHFQYVDEADFEHDNEGFSSPATESTPESAPVGADFAAHSGSVETPCAAPGDIGCLQPETTYRFRVVATNTNGSSIGPEGRFTTLPAMQLGPSWASSVGAEEATLHASLNPLGISATGYLQYVSDASYREDVAQAGPGHGFDHAIDIPDVAHGASPLSFGSDETETQRSVRLDSLLPGSTYHYRYIVTDFFGERTGSEHTFITSSPQLERTSAGLCPNAHLRVGPSAALPDCRAYEMVSPFDKEGGDIVVSFSIDTSKPARIDQASSDGNRVTFSSYRAFANAQAAPFSSQYLAVRDPGGWSDEDISPPEEGTDGLELGGAHDINYKLFSEDLCTSWILKGTQPLLDPEAIKGYANLYQREDCGSGGYTTITKGTPVGVNIDDYPFIPAIEGVSDDGSRVFFDARGKLVAGASTEPQAYESYQGVLHLVCYLPNGHADTNSCTVGSGSDSTFNYEDSLDHAVSDDGRRVYWTDDGNLYVRLNPEQPQSAIHAGQCAEPENACTLLIASSPSKEMFFWGASADGERVLYGEGYRGPGTKSLYEAQLQKTASGTTVHVNVIDSEDRGLMGFSEDASLVYLASNEVLTSEPNATGAGAQTGQPNLYLYRATDHTYTFIATLPEEDFHREAETFSSRPIDTDPYYRSSRISPDGLHAVFMSGGSLTGYDSVDQQSDEPDTEVFLYDAVASGGPGTLRCISCQASGARPSGRNVGIESLPDWVASAIPGWETDLHPSRVLSDDGNRVFFDSFDALVPSDTNGAEDVYEWEAGESKEQCAALGAAVYLAREGGCLSLISTGESPADSEFMDASRDGSDVFFTTGSSLVPQDSGGQIDVYDARVDGGFPGPPAPAPACEGEACQNSPSPPIELTPASLVFAGAGNVVAAPSLTANKTKAKPKSRLCRKPHTKKRGATHEVKGRGAKRLIKKRGAEDRVKRRSKCIKEPRPKKPRLKRDKARRVGRGWK